MRQIKFRLWMDNEMLSHEQLVDMDQETHAMYTIITKPKQVEELVFMQYTGLKDLNGVEIYEGDIYENKNGIKWVVYYDERSASYLADAINADYKAKAFINRKENTNGRVIGNIYENPELLNS